MNKMCKGNDKARELAGAMLCPDTMGEDVSYKQVLTRRHKFL